MEKESDIEIHDTTDVFVVWVNSDLTEGRGFPVPHGIYFSRSTAIRRSKGVNVQGSNGNISQEKAFRIMTRDVGMQWYVPGRIERPTKKDEEDDKKAALRISAIRKARDAGMTEEEIELLSTSD